MQQIADEHGLELAMDLPAAGTVVPQAAPAQMEKSDDLTERLAALRAKA